MLPLPNLKLIAAGLALAVLIGSHIWAYQHGKDAEKAIQQAEYIKALQARDAEIQRQASINRKVSHDYQIQLTDLDARYRDVLARPPIVRMRTCPADRLPAASRSTPGITPTPTGDGLPISPETPAERDLGPDLVMMAKDADMCVQRLLALQAWARMD